MSGKPGIFESRRELLSSAGFFYQINLSKAPESNNQINKMIVAIRLDTKSNLEGYFRRFSKQAMIVNMMKANKIIWQMVLNISIL